MKHFQVEEDLFVKDYQAKMNIFIHLPVESVTFINMSLINSYMYL